MQVNAAGSGDVYADLGGIVHPDPVLNLFGIESGGAKFSCDVVGGCLVLAGAGNVRRLGQNAEVLFCQFRIRHSKKLVLYFCFRGGIAKPENYRTGAIGNSG